jgi:predicted phage-related endonuclease
MGSKPTGISGSRAAGLLNISEWSSTVQEWLKIMEEREPGFCKANNYEKPERKESAAMAWGTAMENNIVNLASREQRSFIPVSTLEKEFTHPEHDFITCHIDGMYANGNLHEGKTTNSKTFWSKFGTPGTAAIPANYKIQVQHQMMLTGAPQTIVSVLVFPKMQDEFGDLNPSDYTHWAQSLYEMGFFHQYVIDADPVLHQMMLEIYKEFWRKNVLGKVAPDCTQYEDIRKLVRNPIGTIVADDDIYRLSQTYKEITKEMGTAKEQKEKIKTEILNYMKRETEKNGETIDGDTRDKWVLRDSTGKKLHQFNGRKFT